MEKKTYETENLTIKYENKDQLNLALFMYEIFGGLVEEDEDKRRLNENDR